MVALPGTKTTGAQRSPTDPVHVSQMNVATHTNDPSELEQQAAEDQATLDEAKGGDNRKPRETREKLFPIRLLRNYRPLGEFKIMSVDTEKGGAQLRDPTLEEAAKIPEGTEIHVPKEEANRALKLKIAERVNESF